MRKLAIGAAAALSTVVLAAGSAGAQPAPDDAGIAQQGDVVINEVAAELSGGPSGGFVELANIHPTEDADVGGWEVTGCTDGDTFSVRISGALQIPADGGRLLVADANYGGLLVPTPDAEFGSGEVLEQAAGGVRLEDDAGVLQDEIMWGPDNPGVPCASTNAGVLPTDSESINLGSPWFLAPPTPGS